MSLQIPVHEPVCITRLLKKFWSGRKIDPATGRLVSVNLNSINDTYLLKMGYLPVRGPEFDL